MEAQTLEVQSFLRQGVAAARSGDVANARIWLQQAVHFQPGNELGWLWLASIADNPMEAVSCWRRVMAINPTQSHAREGIKLVLFQEALKAARLGQKAEARQMLMEVSQIDSGNELVWLWLASVAETVEEAVSFLQRVLEIKPGHERATQWLTKLQPQTGNCLLCGAGTNSDGTQCTQCLSILSLKDPQALLNNFQTDAAALTETMNRLESIPEDRAGFEVHYKLALAYFNLRQTEKGFHRLKMAATLRPEDTQLQEALDALNDAYLYLEPEQERPLPETPALAPLPPDPQTPARTTSELPSFADQICQPEVHGDQRTVLVVDDSATIRKLVSVTLSRYGYRVAEASNGMEALARMNEVVPDLILLDITMPQMDGYQLCRLIKGNDLTKAVPVVMLSGKDGFFDKMRGRMVGASEYLTKPFEPHLLLQTVDKHCALREKAAG
jgi:twitching motility two-component system response regulator PilG